MASPPTIGQPVESCMRSVTVQGVTAGAAVQVQVNGVLRGSATAGATAIEVPITGGPLQVGDHVTGSQTVGGSDSGPGPAVAVVSAAGYYYPTQHFDGARTGWFPYETSLTVANVASLKQKFAYTVDGTVYAQPLYAHHVDVPGSGAHNVVLVATENDTVYALDADTQQPVLWQRSLVPAGETVVTPADVGGCNNVAPTIGITSTPVLDSASYTLYVVAKTKRVQSGTTTFHQRLYALDITNGADRVPPAEIAGSVPGSAQPNDGHGNVVFDPQWHLNRPGLLLLDGVVYAGFGSHCDAHLGQYHGWVFAYQAANLQRLAVFATTPDSPPGAGAAAGVWQGGVGLAADPQSFAYFTTGNGDFSAATGGRDHGNSVMKLTNALSVADWFTPSDQAILTAQDIDLGSGGVLVLPDPAPGTGLRRLLVTCGKDGNILLIDREHLGGYEPWPGPAWDGRPTWTGAFQQAGRAELLWYNPASANWWLGTFDASGLLSWRLAGNTAGFGQVADGRPFWTGDFRGLGRAQILFYYPGDRNWWLGTFDASGVLTWNLAGNTTGFGQVWDGRPFWTGNFRGPGRAQILFYTPADRNWWLGTFDGSGALTWNLAGNTTGFGQVWDGRPFWTGDFRGAGGRQVLFYTPADSNWWLGTFDGAGALTWNLAGNTAGFGQLADGRPFWTGDFRGLGRQQILFYTPADANWWLGTFDASGRLTWNLAGNTAGFGQVADGRPFWTGNFRGPGGAQILFYTPADSNWWLGTFDGAGALTWNLAGNTAGFGPLADGRPFWTGELGGPGRVQILFYYPGDENWWLGTFSASGALTWGLAGGAGPDRIVQRLPIQPGIPITSQPGIWGGPAYYGAPNEQFVYYAGNGGHLRAYTFDGGALTPAMVGGLPNQSPDPFPAEGGVTPNVSSNQQAAGTAVVWAITRSNPLRLVAFDGTNLTTKLLDVACGPWRNIGNGGAFIEPTVVQGKVYVPSDGLVTVFGL